MSECHIWDLLDAPSASIRVAKAKLKAGWKLHALDVSFGGWGGVPTYANALLSPCGEVILANEKTVAQLCHVHEIPQVKTRKDVLVLHVPFETREIDVVKAQGARWVSQVKRWCVRPQDEAKFSNWMPAKRTFITV